MLEIGIAKRNYIVDVMMRKYVVEKAYKYILFGRKN